MQLGGVSVIVRVIVLIATLATLFAAIPATAADACATAPAAWVEESLEDASPCSECPDCGPACETGCCHAGHAVALAAGQPDLSRPGHGGTRVWLSFDRTPLPKPSGPERPPRA